MFLCFIIWIGLKGSELKEAANEALKFVGLTAQANKKVKKMSGGMQRRLNIACGIAHNPKLIVMDEPTVGVDAHSRELIMDSIRILKEKASTIIYTSHYMPEVQEICDRIAIVDKGHLVAMGTEEELLEIVTDLKSVYIEIPPEYIKDSTIIIKKLENIPDIRFVSVVEDSSKLKVDVPLTFLGVSPILKAMMEEDVPVTQIISEAPNLETTFLALTGKELNYHEQFFGTGFIHRNTLRKYSTKNVGIGKCLKP